MALRYRVGIDTLNYMEGYQWVKPIDKTSFAEIFAQFEPLNVLLRSLAKGISDDFVIYQIFHVVLLNALIARFILKHTKNILFALFFYFLLAALYFNTEILRESLAVAVFINAYDYMKQNKWLKYYACIVVAIGFHTSAIITLLMPLSNMLRLNKLFWICSIVFVLVLIQFQNQLEFIALYLDATAGEKLTRYLNSDRLNINWIISQLISTVFFPLSFLYILKKRKISLEYENMVGLYIVMGLGIIPLQIIFSRFTNYFVFFYILLLAEVLPQIKLNRFKIVQLMLVNSLIIWILGMDYFKQVNSLNQVRRLSRWYPYHSIIEKEKDPTREQSWQVEFGR